MAPKKKAQKISLNAFLGDDALGSWADEMDSLPSAPAMRNDDDQGGGGSFGRRGDDFLSSRPDRVAGPPREDLPLPTAPPYTAFIGNLSFDLTESELEDFFSTSQTKSIKIIKDRDDKPKGFGYVEFENLEGLKDGLAKSGNSFAGRTIRVSVAEPPKERSGFGGGGGFDDGKFDDPWRRGGPLPNLPGRENRDGPRRGGFDSREREDRPSFDDGPNDWRASQPARVARPEPPVARRSGFPPSETQGAADREDKWSKGSRLPPPEAAGPGPERGSRFGPGRGDRSDLPPPPASAADDVDQWRSARPARPTRQDSTGPSSPTGSTPSTPSLARRKLELLPRSGSQSAAPSPLGSPKAASATPAKDAPKSNPFGAAKPVDVSSREREVADRVEKEREQLGKTTMSRTSSRTATDRPVIVRQGSGVRSGAPASDAANTPSSPKSASPPPKASGPAATVRPAFSFAKAAQGQSASPEQTKTDVEQVTEKVAQTSD